MLTGFQERFDYEIRDLSKHDAKTEINVFADLYRKHAAWIGGSMIASFSTFKDMTIKRDDYENGQE
jgi:actin-related protein